VGENRTYAYSGF